MSTTRCKFRCTSVTDYGYGREVKLTAQYDESIKEDQSFSQATPSGDLTFTVTNPNAFEMFKPNQCYYLDLTAVPVEPSADA